MILPSEPPTKLHIPLQVNMSTTAKEASSSEPPCMVRGTPVLHCLDENTKYGDFRDDLARDGYAVVKGVLSKEKCDAYIDDIHDWLESFGLGYNRHDPSTVKEECLPIIHQKGLIQAYGAPHEVRRTSNNHMRLIADRT